MMTTKPEYPGVTRRIALIVASVSIVDLGTKSVAEAVGRWGPIHPVINEGYALGLPAGPLGFSLLLSGLGIVALGGHALRLCKLGRLPAWVPGFLIGGALANLTDRALNGAVRDFILTPWVIGNVADLAVLAGLSRYVAAMLLPHRSRREVTA